MKFNKIVFKSVKILILAIFLTSCSSKDAENKSVHYLKIEKVVSDNFRILKNRLPINQTMSDLEEALVIAKRITQGDCPSSFQDKIISNVLSILIVRKNNISNVHECLLSAGFNREDNYHVMVDKLVNWGDNPAVIQFYRKFYRNYTSVNDRVMGLLDLAELNCAHDAAKYLRKDGYPKNVSALLSEDEYRHFKEYIKDNWCEK